MKNNILALAITFTLSTDSVVDPYCSQRIVKDKLIGGILLGGTALGALGVDPVFYFDALIINV